MQYRRCGDSDVTLSAISLGIMVRDTAAGAPYEALKRTVLEAVDAGINSIDAGAGYASGAIEEALGQVVRENLSARRSELVLATKGGWADGTRDTLMQSINDSLRRLGLEYVDLFYHHAPDPNTPLEVTAAALGDMVRAGKTRYIGISNYTPWQTQEIAGLFREAGTPCIIHQLGYNMLHRWPEDILLDTIADEGLGCAVFGAVSQGLLAQQYVGSGPMPGSRAANTLKYIVQGVAAGETEHGYYPPGVDVEKHVLHMLEELADFARQRNQTLSQLAVSWVLRHPSVTTTIVGISNSEQLRDAIGAVEAPLSDEEVQRIEGIIPSRG